MTGDRAWDITCRELVELVTDYLDGALDGDLRLTVEAHLAACPPCALYVEQMRDVAKELGQVPLEPALDLPEPVVHDLLAAFRTEPR